MEKRREKKLTVYASNTKITKLTSLLCLLEIEMGNTPKYSNLFLVDPK